MHRPFTYDANEINNNKPVSYVEFRDIIYVRCMLRN